MNERTRERYIRNIQRVVNMTVADMQQSVDLTFYNDVFQTAFCSTEPTDQKYIGTYCVMIPDELIYALGYTPLRLCAGHQIPALLGDEMIPRDACPVVKASAGFHAMRSLPMYDQCEIAVMPMTCEAKRKSTEVLAQYIPIVPLPVPMSKGNEAFEKTVDLMGGLVRTLELHTGKRLSNFKLVRACLDINTAQKQAYLLQQKLYAMNPQVKGSEVMYALNSYCYTKPKTWAKATKKLIAEIEAKEKTARTPKRHKPRVFIAGSPISFPNFKVPLMLEDLGAHIVGDESCLSGRLLYDPVLPNDYSTMGMVRALTARYIAACTCPVFDNIDDRLASLKTRMELSGAEGIIYHVLRGCVPYDFELAAVEQFAEQENIPLLRVETDFSTEDVEQIKIRFEAFVEMIDQRRKRKEKEKA